jgi:hypothetical protein
MDTKQSNQQVVLDIFEKGKQFTEELILENEKLRKRMLQLSSDNRTLTASAEDLESEKIKRQISILEKLNSELFAENQELKDQFVYVEDENREFAERYIDVEKQNSDLINLYVASHRLHSTLDYKMVVDIVKEIVINMIGSEHFGIFLSDQETGLLTQIAHEGLDGEFSNNTNNDDERILEAVGSGDVYCIPQDEAIDENRPIACIPMKVDEKVFGVIVIYSLLVQKDCFEGVDFELFELLGNHAATAIFSAQLFTSMERKKNTLKGFLDMIKSDDTTSVAPV